MSPALYLIPVELGDTSQERVLPSYNREVILGIRYFIVEELRSARRFLKRVDKDINIDALTFFPMGKHADAAMFERYLKPLETGESIGVISEAGCPAVADPGSGLNGQSFAFNGYLPIDPAERIKRIKQLEARASSEHQTQLFIETPYRNHKLMETLCQTLRPQTRLCIAAGITTDDEWIRTLTVAQWKRTTLPDLSKTPAIFLFG